MATLSRHLRATALGLLWACVCAAAGGPSSTGLPGPIGTYAFRSYGTHQGLTNLSLTALAQDSEGFLWAGTEEGLFRLEGSRLRRLGREDGLPDDSIESNGIGASPKGGLWVSTGKGTVYWDGRRFLKPSQAGVPGFDAIPGAAVAGGGMIFKDASHHRFLVQAAGPARELKGLPLSPGLRGAWMSPDGKELLVAHESTLWRESGGVWSSRNLEKSLGGQLLAFLKDRQGRYWVRSERKILRFGSFEEAPEDLSSLLDLSFVNSCNLVEDAGGRIWTNTAGSLAWYDGREAGLLSEIHGLPEGGGQVILIDQEGTLWIGGNGLHRQLGGFIWSGHTRKQGLPAHVVWSLTRTGDGRLWAGTADGLALAGPKAWQLLAGTSQRQIMAVLEDSSGYLWAGPSGLAGEKTRLFRVAPGQSRVEAIPVESLSPGQAVICLARAPDGLWIGSGTQGLHRLRQLQNRWSARKEGVPAWGSKDVSVSALFTDAAGHLWVASSLGVDLWDGQGWHHLGQKEGLDEDDLLSLAILPNGNVWIAYRNAKALSRVRFEGGALRLLETIRRPHPLLESPILSLAATRQGELWLGTSLGIKRWDGRRIDRFGRENGLPGEDCAQNALWVDPDGDLWAGVSVGIAHFHASRETAPPGIPGVRILQAEDRDGRPWEAGKRPHQVPYRNRTVTFRYLPVGNPADDSPVFQVRLVGLEDDWRETSVPEARYPSLAAGSYRFEVRLKSWAGAAGPASSLAFEVATPWWQAWWFRLAAVALVGAAAWAILRRRTALLERRNLELERLVRMRTEALEQANMALQEMSMGDPLTHLRNRRFLGITMPEEIARILRIFQGLIAKGEDPRGRNEDLILLMVDLDRFKAVNDTYGHRAGDAVLQQTADLLREVCRESDTLVRWGGEEFLILAKRANRAQGDVIARNIHQAFREKTFLLPGGGEIRRTCCVGYTAFPVLPMEPEAFRWEEAIEIADQCLYAAKNSGRDGWVGAYCATGQSSEGLRPGLLSDLESLVEAGAFKLSCSHPDPRQLTWK
jgi:diguanylate cyclase (GGDEF)-like protein